MSSRRVLLGLAALGASIAIVAGCGDLCARNSDCGSGMVCTVAGTCIIPPDATIDGGSGGTTVDAAVDADTTDADTTDAAIDARVGT